MLLQSHAGVVDLLPALPRAWARGRVRGLRARGGFEVEISWDGGRLQEVHVRSDLGRSCALRFGEKTVRFNTRPGGEYRLDGELEPL
jgi:alpha-L-fucosidase 2